MFAYSQEMDAINLCHKVITVIHKTFISLPKYLSVGASPDKDPKGFLFEHFIEFIYERILLLAEHIYIVVGGRRQSLFRSQHGSITFQQRDMCGMVVQPFIGWYLSLNGGVWHALILVCISAVWAIYLHGINGDAIAIPEKNSHHFLWNLRHSNQTRRHKAKRRE